MPNVQVVLLGGHDERPAVDEIIQRLHRQGRGHGVIDSGTDHDEHSFIAVVEACDAVFTGDTMAMHVAVALKKAVVAWFGPTCEQEIDLFGRGEKLVADVPCGPCYKRHCDHSDACVKEVTVDDAVTALRRVLERSGCGDLALPRDATTSRGMKLS